MRKKGFTLIELLAVIVILAILALITVPIVLRLVNNARKDSAIRSAENYLDGVKKAVMNDSMNTESEIDECIVQGDGNIFCNDKYPLTVEVDGKKPNSGTIAFANGTISDVTDLHFGKYWVNGETNNLVANSKSTTENRADGEYLVGDKLTYKGDRYYVIAKSSSSQDYVVAMRMWPLSKDEIENNGIDNEGNSHINVFPSDTNYRGTVAESNDYGNVVWHSSTNCTESRNCEIQQHCDEWGSCWDEEVCNEVKSYDSCPTSYDSSDIKVIVDNWAKNSLDLDDLVKVGNYKARLVSNDDVVKSLRFTTENNSNSSVSGNPLYFSSSKTPRWAKGLDFSYWTMNTDEDARKPSAALIANGGIGSVEMWSRQATIRPVINLKKTAIGS